MTGGYFKNGLFVSFTVIWESKKGQQKTPRMWGGEIRVGILVFNYLRVKPTRPFHPAQTAPPIQSRIE